MASEAEELRFAFNLNSFKFRSHLGLVADELGSAGVILRFVVRKMYLMFILFLAQIPKALGIF